MALLLSNRKTFSLISNIGLDLLGSVIYKICQSITYSVVYFHRQSTKNIADVYKHIYLFDLEAKIVIIHAYLKCLVSQTENDIPNSDFEKIEHLEAISDDKIHEICQSVNDPKQIGLIYIFQSLQKIDAIFNQLKSMIDNHQIKWFSYWRSLDVTLHLQQLKIEIDILNNRLKLIQNLSTIIYKNLI